MLDIITKTRNDINIILKKERDAILLYLWELNHNELDKSNYILETLQVIYELGYNECKKVKK